MSKKSLVLSYECIPERIPEILNRDWEFNLQNKNEQKLAISAIALLCEEADYIIDSQTEQTEDDTTQVAWRKSWYKNNGELCFVLDTDRIKTVRTIMFIISTFTAQGLLAKIPVLLGFLISIVKVSKFNSISQCVLAAILVITMKDRTYMFGAQEVLDFFHAFNGERPFCSDDQQQKLACDHWKSCENACLLNDDEINNVIDSFKDKILTYIPKKDQYVLIQ